MGYLTRAVVYAFLGSIIWLGCDTMPGTEDTNAFAPFLIAGNVLVSPQVIDSDLVQVSNGVFASEITVSVTASDEDGDLQRLFAVVQNPSAGASAIGTAEVALRKNGPATLKMPVNFPEGSVGNFQVVVFASDAAGRISNRLLGQIEIVAGSLPPVIESIEIPTSATRPAAGQPPVQVPIVVTVSDPDGLSNVLGVEVIVNGAVTLQLCDDGGTLICNAGFGSSGDLEVGDGKYTLTIQLTSTNAVGTNQFEFTAVDRTGLRSETLTRIITVN